MAKYSYRTQELYNFLSRTVFSAKESLNNFIKPYLSHYDYVEILIMWTIFLYVLVKLYNFNKSLSQEGYKKGITRILITCARRIPAVRKTIDVELEKTKKHLEEDFQKYRKNVIDRLPEKGLDEQAIKEKLSKGYNQDLQFYKDKKLSGVIYYDELSKVPKLVSEFAKDYFYHNQLHFDTFPAVGQMEVEVISMVRKLFNGDEKACGLLTSGGTESIMMAMLAYREEGAEKGITEPEIVMPETAHAAFEKAAFYYKMRVVKVPVDHITGKVKANLMKKAISKNTVCLVGSAPNYPYGAVDPIDELGKLALKYKIGLHVDCCLGGFVAPFASKHIIGETFDFENPGVTSISADPHKYGLAPKGVSVVLFRTVKLRSQSIFVSTEWCGGLYATPAQAGSRSGALIVGGWVAMMSVGYKGYKDMAESIIKGTLDAAKELKKNPYIRLIGDTPLGVFGFVSENLNCYDIIDMLKKRGWHVGALQKPAGVHLSVTAYNVKNLPVFVRDVKEICEELIKNPPKSKGSSAQLYGSAAKMPETLVREGAKVAMEAYLKI